EAFGEAGQALVGEVGELVITEPMPSMPISLWNDTDGRRYHESYFEMYPGLWRHGDWIRFTDRGSCVIEGRSDSTLKRMGVRMGSGDFYRVLETLPEIRESLIVGLDLPGGQYWMPLFVVPQPGVALDAALVDTIMHRIRTALSPRHVPDAVLAIDAVPRTLNGKKLEVPVKKLLLGWPLAQAVNLGAVANPHALQCFVDLAQRKRSQGQTSLQWELKPTVPPSQCGRQCLPGSPAQRITSFAWKRSVGGMVRPRVWAVLRLMTNSNCVSCSTGRSAGLAPRRILST